ncbi:MAG TPA: hypothetical protein VMH79_12570 [Thermoanaerobaculia bacterium]|nr:hypothetical protein [Thermoanaerobaculia bacterium]
MDKARRFSAVLALLVLAASIASPLSFEETGERLSRLAAALTGAEGYDPEAASFWFDPEYASFLEDVARRTPENATVAVLVPESPDLYFYQAVYRLAPRRVVGPGRRGEAGFVAAYGPAIGQAPDGQPVTHGRLETR